MKIKLAILEQDTGCLKRIVSVFSTKYSDKLQVYSFTDLNMALDALDKEKIDVFLATDLFEIDISTLPKRCGFAYFVNGSGIDSVNGQRAVCKFQKAELIYKQILNLYSENAGKIFGFKPSDESCKVITFSSPAGGTGTSTMAAACSVYYALKGKKVLYLDFDNYGVSDIFFSGEGQNTMSDVVFAVKSRNVNLGIKLMSYVKQDRSGVNFYSSAKYALDMAELNHSERMQLLDELKNDGTYEYIIVDSGFGLDRDSMDIFRKSAAIVMVSDGTEIANLKTDKAYEAIIAMDQSSEIPISNRFCLLYNKFSNKTGTAVENEEIKNIGGAPFYIHASSAQVLNKLSSLSDFDKIISG